MATSFADLLLEKVQALALHFAVVLIFLIWCQQHRSRSMKDIDETNVLLTNAAKWHETSLIGV